MSVRTRAAAVLLALVAATSAARGIQEPTGQPGTLSEAELDRRTAEVADRLRCPVCRNQSVLESSSELARSMQGVIREKLAAGESPEQIEAYFVRSYGEWILLRPEPEGVNLLVYVLPIVALLLGGVAVAWWIRRWSRAEAVPATADVGAATPARADDRDPEPSSEGSTGESADFDEEEERWLRAALRES